MGIIRAMVTIEGKTRLPKDRYVNVFHLGTGAPWAEDALELAAQKIVAFYREGGSSTLGVAEYFSGAASAQSLGNTVKMYDLGDPKPRPVRWEEPWGLPTVNSGTPLPNEVAVTMSFYADRNLRRQRGRVFLGPLIASVAEVDGETGDVRPNGTLLTAVRNAGEKLQADLAGAWTIYSPTDGVARPVTNGWVDNAFDTIRARGVGGTLRQSWGD